MSTPDFFRSRLDAMVDPRRPLAVLAGRLDWAQVEARIAPLFAPGERRRTVEDVDLFQDVLSALNLPMTDARKAAPPSLPFERAITLEGVGYRYPGGDADVLSDISLTIPKGSRVGIVGRTGSGKSTLMDLLMGLLEPDRGRIRIDGTVVDAANRQA